MDWLSHCLVYDLIALEACREASLEATLGEVVDGEMDFSTREGGGQKDGLYTTSWTSGLEKAG